MGVGKKTWVIKLLFWVMIFVYRFRLKSLLGIKGIAFSSMIKMELMFSTWKIVALKIYRTSIHHGFSQICFRPMQDSTIPKFLIELKQRKTL